VTDRLRHHRGLAVILVLYTAVAMLYGVTIPIFETPDANGHYAYIHELTEGRGLPAHDTPSGARVTGYVAGHSPLYYALCAAVTFWVPDDVDFLDWAWFNPHHAMGNPSAVANKNRLIHTPAERFPWRGTTLTMHIARLVSTALGGLAVAAAYGIVIELLPGRRWLALGAAALTAFNPMFVFTAARVSNDVAGAAFGSLAVWRAVRLAVRGLSRRGLVLAGAALGLAALSKLSGLTLIPAVALALLFDALRDTQYTIRDVFRKEPLLRWVVHTLILFGAAVLVCSWWFVRNWLLYGELSGVNAWISHTRTVWPEPIGFLDVIPYLKGLEMSYWAMFGWFNIAAAPWMYTAWRALVRLALVGLVFVLLRQWTVRRFSRAVQAGLVTVVFAFLLTFGSVWRFIMIVPGAQGRYLMPVVAAISALLMLGLSQLLPRRWVPGLALSLGVGHLALTLVCLFAFILPAYALPKVVQESELPDEMMRFDLLFEGTPIQLLGGHIEADSAFPGEPLPVNLYWRALEPPQEDLFAFVQILGREAEPIAGVTCYPGRGNFPPTLWQPGDIYQDRYHLVITSGAEVPAVASLHAGLRREGQHVAALSPSGEKAPDLLLLDLVSLRPVEPLSEDVAYSVDARLGEAITLVGYDLDPPLRAGEGMGGGVRPGETLTVTLVWRAEATPEADYAAFVHLVDEGGDLVAQDDRLPLGGEYRTPFWLPGDVVRDTYRLTLDEDQSPCECTLLVGMYDPVTHVRLPAYDGLGRRFENDAIIAGGVTVQ
jgi:hypothetical protein